MMNLPHNSTNHAADALRSRTQSARKPKAASLLRHRLAGLLLALAMIAGVFTGCGNEARPVAATVAPVTPTPAQTQTVPESTTAAPVEIKVMMIGDMLIHPGVYKSGFDANGNPSNYDHFFANILPEIQAADIRIVNQETVLGGTALGLSGYPCFNSPQEIGDSIVKAGFNVVLHASNHTLDKGLNGAMATITYWKTKHPEVAVLGINETQKDAENIYVYEKDGFKVAILNYTYGTNGIAIPANAPYIVNTFNSEERVRSDIRKAHQLADMVIVCPHWGTEYVYTPDSFQKKWTSVFLEEKVDLVLGTHPHVLENVEKLTSADGHEMVVYYSLGNFVSSQNYIPRILGGMAQVTLVKDGERAYIKTYEIEPIITHRTNDSTFCGYKLSDYTDALLSKNILLSDHAPACTGRCYCGAAQVGVTTHGVGNFSVEYCKRFCKAVLGAMYKE